MEVTNTMRKHITGAACLALGVATLASAGTLSTLVAGAANADSVTGNTPTAFSPVVGHVYLDDNTVGTNTIGAFYRHLDGSLSAMSVTHDGQFLFAVNTGSGSISRYWIAPNGTLGLLGSTPVSATGGVGAVDARLSPDGRTLYVDESRIGAVGAFAVNGGNLTELPSSPTSLPTGATPAGVVVN
jgi:6-phosphogluconolactonase (cycloisomerase 2 family)